MKLFGFERIFRTSTAEEFRSEVWDAGKAEHFALRERIADVELTMVVDTDDVAGNGIGHQHAVVGHEGEGVRDLHLFAFADMEYFHTRLVFAGADAEECDTVAVLRIHVGLNLEHKAGELGLIGFYHPFSCVARLRCRGPIHQGIQHVLNAEVIDTGTEEYRRLRAFQESFKRERLTGALNQFDAFANIIHFQREEFVEARIVESFDYFNVVGELFSARREALHAIIEQGKDTAECFAHADRPGDRSTVDLQNIFNLAEQINRILNFSVEFVDERNDRSLAHTADFEQFDGLCFHALGGIDDHDGAVHRR